MAIITDPLSYPVKGSGSGEMRQATYHTIGATTSLYGSKEVQVHVFSFADKAARDAGASPASLFSPLRLSLNEWGGEVPSRDKLYAYLMKQVPALNAGQAA